MLSGWVGDSTKYNIRLGAKILPRFLMFILIGEFFKLQMVNIAIALKALICILAGIKWIRYIRKENKAKYFKYSFWCIGIYWAAIFLSILVKGELGTEFFLSTFLRTSERTLFFHLEMVYIVMIILFGTPYLT